MIVNQACGSVKQLTCRSIEVEEAAGCKVDPLFTLAVVIEGDLLSLHQALLAPLRGSLTDTKLLPTHFKLQRYTYCGQMHDQIWCY